MSKIEKNRELCKKYPFLLPRDRPMGEIIKGYDYSYTVLDEELPVGWKIAFGEQLCEEIMQELNKKDYAQIRDSYCVEQAKEKYGYLRWYTNWTSRELDKIIKKYQEISERTCVDCGEPATKISLGWINPYCDKCAEKINENSKGCVKFQSVDEFFKERR